MKRKDTSKLLDNALDILIYLQKNGLRGIREISNDLNISKSSVQRIINTLYERHFIVQDEDTGKYQLGLRFLELGMVALEKIDSKKRAYVHVKKLADKTRETVQLVALDGEYLMYVESIESSFSLGVFSRKGIRKPIYYGAAGQVLLAYMDRDFINNVLNKKTLEKFSSNTITNPQKLIGRLDEIRKQGYLILYDDPIDDIVSIAAPIKNYKGEVILSVACGIPSVRFEEATKDKLVADVLECAKNISIEYGMPIV